LFQAIFIKSKWIALHSSVLLGFQDTLLYSIRILESVNMMYPASILHKMRYIRIITDVSQLIMQ
jgi:hypothetical protein